MTTAVQGYYLRIWGDGHPVSRLVVGDDAMRTVLREEFFGDTPIESAVSAPEGEPTLFEQEAARWADFCDPARWDGGAWREDGEDYTVRVYRVDGEFEPADDAAGLRQRLARKAELLDSTVAVADARLEEIASLHGAMTTFQREVAAWGINTFPAATLASTFAHLRRELAEVEADPADPVEWADVLLIFLHASHRFGGMRWERILAAAREKLEINRQRQWGEPDAEGVVEHVRESAT